MMNNIYNNCYLNKFLRIYFLVSFVLLCILMTKRLYVIENESIESNKYFDERVSEYQRKVIQSLDTKYICDQTNIRANLKSIEHLRRSYATVQEIFNYLTITFNKTNLMDEKLKNTVLSEVSDRKNVIHLEVEKLSKILGIEKLKTQRLNIISKRIQNKIFILQNPPKELCHKIPKFICKLSVDAGFASGIHSILWCLVSAYHKNQTVILIPDWTKYFGRTSDVWERMFESIFTSRSREDWNNIFMPLSSTCDYKDLPKQQLIYEEQPNTVIHRKLMNQLPKEFGSELISLVDSPNSWFQSQFIGYILRPQQRLKDYINQFKRTNNFSDPIVGIHVRRTDKISFGEALYYPINDYMIHVKDFFDKIQLTNTDIERRVYVASDDPSVFDKFKKQYPEYIFIGSTLNAKIASSQTTRYSNASLWGILTDIYLLSDTDYIVCTFSSAICRLSYELMRYKQLDASYKYRSLDVPFHYHHSLTPIRTVIYNHIPKNSDQWNLKIGDHLHERIRGRFTEWFDQAINGRGWDSYFYASNSSKQRFYKLYPIYKVFDDLEFV